MKKAVFNANQMNGGRNGPLPAAEEQRHNQGGHGDDTDVFPTKNRPNFMPEYSMW